VDRERLRIRLVDGIDRVVNRPFLNWLSPEDREILLGVRQAVNQDDGSILDRVIKCMGPRYEEVPGAVNEKEEEMAKKNGAKPAGKGNEAKSISPEQILDLIEQLGEAAPVLVAFLKKVLQAWKQQPKTAAGEMAHCPAAMKCCDRLVENLAESLCLAMHCKKCCSPEDTDEEDEEVE
jgi:hypothetical protein